MSKKHIFLRVFSKITISVCVFCAFFISPVFATLPAGYTELEYIDVPQSAYIDLGMYPAAHGRLRVKFSPIELGSNYLCGYRIDGKVYSGIMGSLNGNTINSGMVRDETSGTSVTSNIIREKNNVYDIQTKAKYVEGSGYTTELTVNNLITGETETVVGKTFVANPISINQNMLLFAVNQTNKLPSARGYFYMYWNDNDELVRNLIPVKRNSDGEIGMYDTVSGQFFENAGTGDFIAGPVVGIKIATTKMVDEEFAATEAKLATTVQTIESVVSRTITQTGQIATLHETKQTRPDETCPANMKCLLVQDEDGTPHWYPIIEP